MPRVNESAYRALGFVPVVIFKGGTIFGARHDHETEYWLPSGFALNVVERHEGRLRDREDREHLLGPPEPPEIAKLRR
jgi:hypothetical protein